MIGPGGSHEIGGVILDTRRAILLENVDVSTIDPDRGGRGQSAVALMLSGRVNQTSDRAKVLFIMGTDGVAGIVSELIALLGRAGGKDVIEEFMSDMTSRLDTLRDDGDLT